ncbi:MAG TPA: YsnF/AvaK domain-containing protein, partial [Acidimicrobiales bacterium]
RPQGYDTSGPTTDDAMTRSEEELSVGTAQREAGRARLRKYIVTEHVQTTVPVSREEVRIEREPITDANRDQALSGHDLSEEEHEVILHEEQPVVEKNVVAKERVKLTTETVTEDAKIAEDLRKERIETDGDRAATHPE